MSAFRQSGRQWLLLVLALVGAGIAIYLTTVHYEQVPLLCSSQGLVNCERVTSSSYSVVPGTTIPITIPGLLWFLVSAVLAVGALRQSKRWIRTTQLVWGALGMLTVLYLVYVELVILHTICAWCTAVHVAIFVSLMLVIIECYLSDWNQERAAEEEEEARITSLS
ncbi:MAG TPA: vitamin K epoxide reductase family protein [Ktedonobacterales bacterium]|nr:vitamin K epoxide reductase family protein [Ktedonobacterales bacterium]